ncbi:MAG: cupin domain-containing protein [Saprospiraceae bacterium]|nr:cupin domain-containing protein [Saprospiraceae bacterium]
MKRKRFVRTMGVAPFVLSWSYLFDRADHGPEKFFFKDDGKIPNSEYPLLVYHDAIPDGEQAPDGWLLKKFAQENWTNAWTNGIYGFHHYHSTSHEVLGIFSGSALLHLGGQAGARVEVKKGDIIIIPAGVGHKRIRGSNLGVVGAYPDGRDWDLLRGEVGERPQADENIKALPIPASDPFLGKVGGLLDLWK